jgi:hypothetical protein
MAFDFSNISDEELEAMAAQSAPASEPMPQKPLSEWTDEELEAFAAEPNPAPAQPAAHSPRMTREERIAANNRAIETARSQEEPGFLSAAGDALAEGAKGAARAVKSIGSGIVGMASGAVRLAGTPVRLATGWEGLHRLADTIDSSYENFGRDALMSEYGENPDGWGYALGRAGEKVAGVAGSLAALGGVGKAVGAAGHALKMAGHAKTAAAVANTLPLMFGNDAAVRAYDTARANGRSKTEAASLAALNGVIHYTFFKMFENQSLKKMLNIGPEVEVMMPKWADALAEEGGQSFSSLVRGTRNGMVKYIAAENGKRALKAGGIMGLQNFLSDPVMQVAEGASIDDIDFSRMLKAGAEGVGEGALMEGLMGGAAIFRSQKAAEKFMADKYFRGKDYKVVGPDGKPHDEPGLLNSSEGRMFLMKQNPDATERVLDIVEHGGTPRPAELDAAFLPPDMTADELKKFASDWRNDLKPYVDEAWAADAPRQTAAPDAASAEPGRDMLSPEEAQSQQKAANDAAERQKVADRRAAADSMMLDFESWNRLYADGKTDLNFDEWRAAGKPGVIEANLTPKTEEAPTSETRANEEPAQPEQAEVVAPATGAEARPVEGAEARAEAADARVVESPAKPAEAAQKPAEAAVEPKVGEDTSAPAKPAEAASRASYATPERKAPAAEAEDAPLPSFLAPETASAEPPAKPKSNRLRRADGTDPLAEKPMPKTLQKAVYKISSAIANRTGTGVITPDEAYGIVKGIAESPGTKHNRTRDFFGPLEKDAAWHESMGLDAESAKNIRDAVLRVSDATQRKKKQVRLDNALKKAETGDDDAPTPYGLVRIASDALDKARIAGNDAAVARAQKALEDANAKFNAEFGQVPDADKQKWYEEQEKEFQEWSKKHDNVAKNELTVLDATIPGKDGTSTTMKDQLVAERPSDGAGTGRGGFKLVPWENGKLVRSGRVKVEMRLKSPATGKMLVRTEEMTRTDLGKRLGRVRAADLLGGHEILASIRDTTDAPQSWTPEAKKPLERVARALRNSVTVGGKRLKVSFADRPEEADGQTRKSVGGIFTGTAADYANRSRQGGVDDGPSLKKIGTGEGSQVYGWGLYGSTVRGVAEGYGRQGRNLNVAAGDAEYKLDGKSLDRKNDVIDSALTYLASERMNTQKAIEEVNRAIDGFKKQLEDTNERLKWDKNNFRLQMDAESLPRRISHLNEVKGFIERDGGKIRQVLPSENIYEQTFFTDRAPGDESHLLKWYEPVSEENAERIDAISRQYDLDTVGEIDKVENNGGTTFFWGGDKLFVQGSKGEVTGGVFYNLLQKHLGSPKAASEFLARAGIDGIKYPVDSYGGKTIKDGDKAGWDYVSFRDDNIRVDHKWTDSELRYMRNADGVTVGEYDAAKGEIRLYPGATVADVVHEFTHPLVDFARAEARAGRGELLGKINQIIDAERTTWEQPVRDAYKGKSNETILEEIFTHAMGEKGADLFGKSTKTLQGRRWYNQLWQAIKGLWQDFATKMGWNKADLRGLERMSPEDAAQKILGEMAKGRSFGDAPRGEGIAEARRVVPPKPSAPPPKIDMSKDESLKEKYLRNMSDRYDPLKRLVEEAKESATKPSDVPDPYHEKRVQSGHNEADRHQIDMLKNKYVDFLKRHSHGQKEQEKLHEEVNMYLRARDALYRNPEMKKRLGVDDGSGMSDAQAHKILDDFKRRMRTPILDQAFKIMQEVKKTYGLQRLVDGGMLDQATADMLEKRNPDYAPQRTSRLDEEGIDRNSTRNMEAAAIKKALGRSTLSDNPVEFLFLQASDAAARTNENRTRQEMAKFVRMFPEVGKVRTVDKTSAYDLKTGKDAWIEDPHDVESENPLVVSFRENGKRMRIEFADTPRGRLLAESMRNEGVNRGPEAFDRMTRAWASTATQLSATFSGRNFQKDTVEVALNSAADTGFSGAGKFLKAQIAQMKPVVSTIREYLTKGTFGGPLGKEFKEFIDAGGSIGGMGREGYEDLKDTFSRKAKGLKMAFSGAHGVKEKVEAILGVTFGKIEDFNKTIEMMSRFNNYRSRRAKGESKKEAVIGSREDSTDFNMYGQQRWLNDVYMFSNSILGGTLRSTKQLATGKNGLKVATAVLAYGFVEAAADVLFNQDDDDEAEKSGLGGAKDLSERERSQTLYFRYGGKYFRIPVHGGPFSALKYTGGLLARAMLGKLSWSDAAKNAGKEWATIGTHFGGAGEIDLTNGPKGIVSSFTPSVARPVAELGMNQDFAGRHIYAPEGFDRTTPKSERGFKSTGDGYKWFARLMNKVGGGNESRSADWSWFDNPPEAYKHIVEAVGKNMVRDIMLGGETVGRAVESAANWENRFTRDDVPFLRDVTRNVPDNSRRYYDALEEYERDKAEFKKTTPERRREMKADKPYLFVGKSLLDGQIEQVKKYMHLERGEVKVGQKWVEPKTPRTEEQKEEWRKKRLALQAQILKRLGR